LVVILFCMALSNINDRSQEANGLKM
jgi:hypothetical protein